MGLRYGERAPLLPSIAGVPLPRLYSRRARWRRPGCARLGRRDAGAAAVTGGGIGSDHHRRDLDRGPQALHDHDPLLGHVVESLVVLEVVPDGGALGDPDVLVEDGVPDPRPPTDVAVVEDHRVLDQRPAVYAHVPREHRVSHHAAGENAANRKSTRLNSSHLGISYAVF